MDQVSATSLKCYSILLVKNKSSNSIACTQSTMSVGSTMTHERQSTSNTAMHMSGTRVPGQRILLKFACSMTEMTVLLTLSEFNEDTELPQPKTKLICTNCYAQCWRIECDKFLAKWKKFQQSFRKVKDARKTCG